MSSNYKNNYMYNLQPVQITFTINKNINRPYRRYLKVKGEIALFKTTYEQYVIYIKLSNVFET